MFNDSELEIVTFWTQDLSDSELLIDAKNLVALSNCPTPHFFFPKQAS